MWCTCAKSNKKWHITIIFKLSVKVCIFFYYSSNNFDNLTNKSVMNRKSLITTIIEHHIHSSNLSAIETMNLINSS